MESICFQNKTLDIQMVLRPWGEDRDQPGQEAKTIQINIDTTQKFQEIEGIGGAFSEIGGKALATLSSSLQQEVLFKLFHPTKGAGFTYCRLPIGASDFGLDAYSLNDIQDDFEMQHFSLSRDYQYLIPFIKGALHFQPLLKLHASPWSPPWWLKDNQSMTHGGQLIDSPHIYTAYANYLSLFVQQYADEGIIIDRLMVQNEPDATTIYPSCLFPNAQMSHFVQHYLYPSFKEKGLTTKLCVGTFRTVSGLQANHCMRDDALMALVDGIGLQYTLPKHLNDLLRIRSDKKILHTESVCYNGNNSWEQAIKLFNDFVAYMDAGCSVYTYWNMILDQTQKSTWGWAQNSLISIDTQTSDIRYNPDFEVMQLIGRYLKPGAKRVESFCFDKRVIAFENADGHIICFVSNLNTITETGSVHLNDTLHPLTLPPYSITALSF